MLSGTLVRQFVNQVTVRKYDCTGSYAVHRVDASELSWLMTGDVKVHPVKHGTGIMYTGGLSMEVYRRVCVAGEHRRVLRRGTCLVCIV